MLADDARQAARFGLAKLVITPRRWGASTTPPRRRPACADRHRLARTRSTWRPRRGWARGHRGMDLYSLGAVSRAVHRRRAPSTVTASRSARRADTRDLAAATLGPGSIPASPPPSIVVWRGYRLRFPRRPSCRRRSSSARARRAAPRRRVHARSPPPCCWSRRSYRLATHKGASRPRTPHVRASAAPSAVLDPANRSGQRRWRHTRDDLDRRDRARSPTGRPSMDPRRHRYDRVAARVSGTASTTSGPPVSGTCCTGMA